MLDRPAWASLAQHHLRLAEGGALAKRYAREVNLFASAADDSPAALEALAALVPRGERVYVLQVPPVAIPPGLCAVKQAVGVQMIAAGAPFAARAGVDDAGAGSGRIVELTDADAPEMLALATLTEPGPFMSRTHQMGRFIGIRIDGRLAAMAGERFRFAGHTEVSGVCTHPDFRGRGFARRLSAAVAAHIEARGDRPFLHAWKTNQPAIALYGALGFRLRAEINVAVLERRA
jgi:predicted GNAT family acetyltransferase